MITSIIITSGACYLLYNYIQPGMIFDKWLLFWGKRILNSNCIKHEGLMPEEIIDIAEVHNKIMMPLGTCIKCFAFWFCLLPSFLFTNDLISFLFVFITSNIISIWLVVKE